MKNLKINSSNILASVLVLIFITTGLWLSACSENKKPIKVGFSGGLTGKLSDLGIAGRNGALLAVEEINASGGINGRPVEFIIKDDKQDADTAIRVDKELINEGVTAIIGHMTSSMSMAVLPMINKEKIVMISPTTSTNKLTGIDDYFFRVMPPNRKKIDHFANYAFNKMGIKNLVFLYDLSNKTYSEGLYSIFKSGFEKAGGKIVRTATFTSGQNIDYSGIAKSVIKASPDAILIVSGAMDAAMICQQLRKTDFDKPILADGWSHTNELIKHGGSAVEGVIFTNDFNNQSKNNKYIEFKTKFKDRFGIESDFASTGGYDAIQLLANVLRGADSFDDLKQHIQKQKRLEGLQGVIEIDRYGDSSRDFFMVRVENGKFVTFGR